ncbi:hypothetical protein HK405_002619, partial [Cladochytrium tenue]
MPPRRRRPPSRPSHATAAAAKHSSPVHRVADVTAGAPERNTAGATHAAAALDSSTEDANTNFGATASTAGPSAIASAAPPTFPNKDLGVSSARVSSAHVAASAAAAAAVGISSAALDGDAAHFPPRNQFLHHHLHHHHFLDQSNFPFQTPSQSPPAQLREPAWSPPFLIPASPPVGGGGHMPSNSSFGPVNGEIEADAAPPYSPPSKHTILASRLELLQRQQLQQQREQPPALQTMQIQTARSEHADAVDDQTRLPELGTAVLPPATVVLETAAAQVLLATANR